MKKIVMMLMAILVLGTTATAGAVHGDTYEQFNCSSCGQALLFNVTKSQIELPFGYTCEHMRDSDGDGVIKVPKIENRFGHETDMSVIYTGCAMAGENWSDDCTIVLTDNMPTSSLGDCYDGYIPIAITVASDSRMYISEYLINIKSDTSITHELAHIEFNMNSHFCNFVWFNYKDRVLDCTWEYAGVNKWECVAVLSQYAFGRGDSNAIALWNEIISEYPYFGDEYLVK